MPRSVVPIASPHCCSASRSSSTCQGKMTCARLLSIRFWPMATPRAARPSISATRLAGSDDDPGGDDALHLGPENAAGHQREFVGLPLADHGMPGVGPALVADHDIVLVGQQVDDFALRLVAPLQADHASHRHGNALDGRRSEKIQTRYFSTAIRRRSRGPVCWLSMGSSKKLENLRVTCAMFRACPNFCRRTRASQARTRSGYQPR